MVEFYDPQVNFSQGGEGETLQVNGFGTAQVISGRLADGACELGAADTADPFCLKGYGTGNLRVTAKFCTMPCDRVGGYDQRVAILVPGIEARCAPRSLPADGGDGQQVMTPEKRFNSFMKCWLFQMNMVMVVFLFSGPGVPAL